MDCDIKMTSKGQITLPKEIRDQLMLKFGDHLQAQIKDGAIILRKKPDNDTMILMEYAEEYRAKKTGLQKVRELTAGLNLNMTEYVRNARDEKK